ncbi:heterokaryon incompatibility protein-domain-containing protein [Phaeosphaeriaceae sp. PMI808]|nr:heterokaryon incompatibility protein-domain-containing protein [Phaeosphaeriaceae sp. PMI808]
MYIAHQRSRASTNTLSESLMVQPLVLRISRPLKKLRIGSTTVSLSIHNVLSAKPRTVMGKRFYRVIKIDQNQSQAVRIVSPTSPVQFLALTYCWGASQQSKTTKANISRLERELIVSDLPRTLQDAILMTRALNFEYIWIDSICILQDSGDDWATESSKMVDIYSGAYLVLAATSASNSDTRFLQPQPKPLVIDLGPKYPEISPLHARRSTGHSKYNSRYSMESYPLYHRAWCMQERELAHRVVHFLPEEMIWNCRTITDCECDNVPIKDLLPGSGREDEFSSFSTFRDWQHDKPKKPNFSNLAGLGLELWRTTAHLISLG